ncbi:MAG: flagellar synthesis regulator FleN, partial [Deltaproteobacteria bacterium]
VLTGEKRMEEILVEGPAGILIIPASSGVKNLTHLSDSQKLKLIQELDNLSVPFDVFLIDTGAGISMNVLFFCVASQETIVVVTPEPTSIADAYALVKVLSRDYGEKEFRILVNAARTEKEALETYSKLSIVAERFLGLSLDYLGYLPYEKKVKDAIMAQKGFISLYPNSPFSKMVGQVARKILASPPPPPVKGSVQFFLRKALNIQETAGEAT